MAVIERNEKKTHVSADISSSTAQEKRNINCALFT